jgi:hypothetical protein
MVKASTVARDLSKPKLEARLGPFEASPERQAETKAKRQYQKKPVRLRVNTVELYARYKADQQTLAATQRAALDKARQRKTGRSRMPSGRIGYGGPRSRSWAKTD